MPVVFDDVGFERALLQFVSQQMPAAAEEVLPRAAKELVREINREWPKDTGRSRQAWYKGRRDAKVEHHAATDTTDITVVNEAEYADEIEYGTEERDPGLHIPRAFRAQRLRIRRSMGRAVRLRWKGKR